MNLPNSDSVIKRFTYDWLIRFFELHPVKYDWGGHRHSITARKEGGRLEISKYHPVSPLFERLSELYMPHVYEWRPNIVVKVKKSFELTPKKVIILRESGYFDGDDANPFLKYGVYFDKNIFTIKDQYFEHAELLSLVSHINCNWLTIKDITTDRKVYLTEVCCFFKNLTTLVLDADSIIVENNFPEVFAKNDLSLCRAHFYNLTVSEEPVVEFLKNNISKKQKSSQQNFVFHFKPEGRNKISMNKLAVALHDTCWNAGFDPDGYDVALDITNQCSKVAVDLFSKVVGKGPFAMEYTFHVT
uniref:RNA_lig_T4_1 domain-containing protein n=1 Tax=Panagrellus redivivus TaxID=6233 RepID=A0A7E4VEB3_PANRE